MNEIKCSAPLKKRLPHPLALKYLLAGGDDYELCFTALRSKRPKIEALSRELSLPLTRIGKIGKGSGLVVHDAAGETLTLQMMGYDHFSA
jgi:thiamine-monophosphate kinase